MALPVEQFSEPSVINDLKLQCPICMHVLSNPVVTECMHHFCKECLLMDMQSRRKRDCPVCRQSPMNVRYDSTLSLIISRLSVHCVDGCPWRGTVHDLDAHRKRCALLPVKCEDCEAMLDRARLAEHACPNARTPCAACNKPLRQSELEGHECPAAPVTCPTCERTMRRDELNAHRESCWKCGYCRQTFPPAEAVTHNCSVTCEDCKEPVMRLELEDHRRMLCPERTDACIVAGCTAQLKRRDLPEHITRNLNAHLVFAQRASAQLAAMVEAMSVTDALIPVIEKSPALLKPLLESGVRIPDEAVATATHEKNREAVKLLLEHGANVNGVQGTFGRTALMYACTHRDRQLVRLLLQHGADVNLRDRYGKTCYDRLRDPATLALLLPRQPAV